MHDVACREVAPGRSLPHPIRQSMASLAASQVAFGAVGTSTQAAQAAHEAAATSAH